MTKSLYPEIDSAGNLANAINVALEKIGSHLKADNEGNASGSFATVTNKNRFSQIYIGAETRLYLPNFWKNGVFLASGATEKIDVLAKSLHFWLTSQCKTQELADKFNFIVPNEKSIFFDEGKEVKYSWNLIRNDASRIELLDFVNLAIQDEILSRLFPYTSLTTLCFSRCTGYPYTHDTPTVTPDPDNKNIFLVKRSDGTLLGSGPASEALKIVKFNLPNGIGPAVQGTSEDL